MVCDLKPGGRYVAADLHQAGGIRVVAKRLQELGVLHDDAQTVTGRTIGEHAREAQETPGQRVVLPIDEPIKATGGLAILQRQSRAGGLRGQAQRARARPRRGARARVRERGGGDGGRLGRPDRGRRRRRHPQRGPRRRPRDARDARGHRRARGPGARRRRRAHHRRPLLRRHPRLHGRPRRARGRPRRADHGRPRWRHDHDRRRLAPPRRRPPRRRDRRPRRRLRAPPATVTNGVFGKYAKLVSSASEGAVTR